MIPIVNDRQDGDLNMQNIIDWLLKGEPWIEYRTRLDLLNQSKDSPQVVSAKSAMISDPKIQKLLAEAVQLPEVVLKRHNDAAHPLHQLTFLADLGFIMADPGIEEIIAAVTASKTEDGPFPVLMNIHPSHGGTGQDQKTWMLCDAPLILYALVKFGLGEDPRVRKAIKYLMGLVRDNGWPCVVAPELGKFRGPGRKDDPCPYATLVMMKLLAELPEYHHCEVCKTGVLALLDFWRVRKEKKIYLFGMGTDFAKLKAPLIWYDILHVADVLTRFDWLRGNPVLAELLKLIQNKANADGLFQSESIWMAWKEWEFGQKKVPSRWVTLLCYRVLERAGMVDSLVTI